MAKLTKQGVRDLGYSKRKTIREPPKEAFVCKHIRVKHMQHGDIHCLDCAMIWDWTGIPY